jgi:hypothetical protein
VKLLKKTLSLCTRIYDEPKIGCVIKNDTDYCEIVKEENNVYVVFRGTDNKLGWKSNFHFRDRNLNDVHDGFEKAYLAIQSDLCARVGAYGLYEVNNIIFTGHSRGGVMAIQAASDYACNPYDAINVSCITFGAPRLGGKYWRDRINRSRIYLTRVEVPGDPVCDVPLRSMGYRKEGNILKLKTPWWWNLGTLPVIRAWKHHPKAYLKAIEYTERRQG